MIFWLLTFVIIIMLTRRWHRHRWVAPAPASLQLDRELDDQRVYVDGLEQRVAELEERLDFTERLLGQRERVES